MGREIDPASVKGVAKVLGLAGGSLGLVSIFLPWISILRGLLTFSLVQMFNLPAEMRNQGVTDVAGVEITGTILLVATLALLIAGSLLSFLRPAGGAMQIAACLLFAIGFNAHRAGIPECKR